MTRNARGNAGNPDGFTRVMRLDELSGSVHLPSPQRACPTYAPADDTVSSSWASGSIAWATFLNDSAQESLLYYSPLKECKRIRSISKSLCEAVRQLVSSPLVPVLRSRATAGDGGGDEGEGDLRLSDSLARGICRVGCQTIFLSFRTQEQRTGAKSMVACC